MAAHFDERAGVAVCEAAWGAWHQTLDEVVVTVRVPPGTSPKQLKVDIGPQSLSVRLRGEGREAAGADALVEGELFAPVVVNESTWTLEDRKIVRVTLLKRDRSAAHTWPSLLRGDAHAADPVLLDAMERKATLERFARENPGLDFSGAEVTGNYRGGGPAMP